MYSLLLPACSALTLLTGLVSAEQWPYNRYYAKSDPKGNFVAKKSAPEYHNDAPPNDFGHWFSRIVNDKNVQNLQELFVNQSVPDFASFDDLKHNLNFPSPARPNETLPPMHLPQIWPEQEAAQLFGHLPFELDPRCTADKRKWWYRTFDGSCNWLKNGEMNEGQYGMGKSRDYGQYSYADGVSKPREGPNARAVSNAFFRRNETIYFEHTPLLLGLVEFIMHDITWSSDSPTEYIDVPMPEDEDIFPLNTTMRVWRSEAVPGTGTSRQNPRENINRATTWLDLSALYGSSQEVADKLRTFSGGKLLTQELKTRGAKTAASYLPFNGMDVPTRTRPGVDMKDLFAGGDPRTNEDWVMVAVHTLFLREHNRLCDILAKKHPEYNDEQLFQTVRLLLSAKFSLIGNAYQMAYFKEMPWPADDGFPLFRIMQGKNWLQMNPANNYPWPVVTKHGKPTVVSAEMAAVYRFHEFIVNTIPIKDALNETLWDQNLFQTAFNAKGFVDAGLENILRGVVSTYIPNFKSGVDEDFRSAGRYRGMPFDIVVWSIIHEREQGLPTFNDYFRAYNAEDPDVTVDIRETFEQFSKDPEMVAALKELYKTPDDVDLVVGCQLDDELFPHASIPKSSLIISLFSLIKMGNSDRFSIGFAAMRCLLVDKPWDCHPSNALEELIWKPNPKEDYPNNRWYDEFWMNELDFQANGANLLWRLVTENSEIDCLQRDPLFPVDPDTNPILCSLPKQGVNVLLLVTTAVQVSLSLIRQHRIKIIATLIVVIASIVTFSKIHHRIRGYPQVMMGWPIIGKAADFQKDSKSLILQGLAKFGSSASKAFGIRIAGLTHYLVSEPEDIQMMIDDAPYEMKFSLSKMFETVNMDIILRKVNFSSNLHTNLIKTHLGDRETVHALGKTIEAASKHFLETNPLVPAGSESQRHEALSAYMDRYITSVCARVMVGADADNHPELIDMFLKHNVTADNTMGIGSFLPRWLRFLADIPISLSYHKFRKIFIPIVRRRRTDPTGGQGGLLDFMPFILEVADDDKRAADLVTVSVWVGLRNLQITITSTLLDIINDPEIARKMAESLSAATVQNLDTFGNNPGKHTPWESLRSAMFESIRLCGSATGPARMVVAEHDVALVSDPSVRLPPNQVATLSSYLTHRLPVNWGPNAAEYVPGRFLGSDPDIGAKEYISWGLKGPHTCPGRWFVQEVICLMTKAVLDKYTFVPDRAMDDEEKYAYKAGVVTRNEVPVDVKRRN